MAGTGVRPKVVSRSRGGGGGGPAGARLPAGRGGGPGRAAAVAGCVGATAERHQVPAFTCHSHVVDLLRSAVPSARVVSLSRR